MKIILMVAIFILIKIFWISLPISILTAFRSR